MPDDDLTLDEDPLDVTEEPETGTGGPKQLRDALARSNAEVARLREGAMTKAFTDLGLDPGKGIGKAASQTFEGEAGDLAEYVLDEYDYLGPANPLVGTIAGQQARLDAISLGAGSVANPSLDDILAKAEAERDNATTLSIKGQQIEQMLRP